MAYLGHTQIAITMNLYAHVATEAQREMATIMDGLFPETEGED